MPSSLRFLLTTTIAALLIASGISLAPSEALAGPKVSAKKKDTAKPRVAVLYFDHIGQDAELNFLRKGLTQMLISDLSDGSDLVIVERTDLEMVMQELKLSQTKFISRRTANKIGKMLGAQYLITGSYNNFRGTLHLTAKVINVELSTVEGVVKHGKAEKFMELEHELAGGLRRKLAEAAAYTSSSKKARRAQARRNKRKSAAKSTTESKGPTNKATSKAQAARGQASLSAQTVSRYGKALDSIDKGDKKLALKELGELTKANPDFVLAADELKVLLR